MNVVIRKFNIALLAMTLFAAVGFGWTTAKKALAYGPGDGVCANVIGTANCPAGATQGDPLPFGTTCHQSSAWYVQEGTVVHGPFYNCCLYAQVTILCMGPGTNVSMRTPEYFRSMQNSSTCVSRNDVTICESMWLGP